MAEENQNPQRAVRDFQGTFQKLRDQLGRVIVGHREMIDHILTAFFAGGHVLIEGVPGTGKTLLVRSLGSALNLSFNRVQFTVDLMPADITGTRILTEEHGRRVFAFMPGPLFTHVLLADEINRATPKTQSALLEAMAELQVTVAGQSHQLEAPFFVLATLNPIEMEGTFPLPEAQLDRFLFKVVLPYPDDAEMRTIIGTTTGPGVPEVDAVFAGDEAAQRVQYLRSLVREVLVAPPLEGYAAALVRATVPNGSRFAPATPSVLPVDEQISRYVSFGSSPRGGQALLLGAKVRALVDGRVNISFADIDAVAVAALQHRLVLNFAAIADGIDARNLIQRIVDSAAKLRH